MAEHLTPDQIARYLKRALSAGELVAAGEHLAGCEPCRELASDAQTLSTGFAFLRRDLETQGKLAPTHLEYEQLEAYVDNDADEVDREIVDSHVELCRMCREELRDLQKFRGSLEAREIAPHVGQQGSVEPLTLHASAGDQEMPTFASADESAARGFTEATREPATHFWRHPGYLAGFASAVAIVIVIAWIVPTRHSVAKLPNAEQTTGSAIGPESQQELQTPAQLSALIGKTGTLLGNSAQGEPFLLLTPVGTFVEDERPTFRWRPLAGASSYEITVFDAELNEVAASPALSGTDWKSSAQLERGKVYLWQVAATTDGEQVVAPVPPAPEAKFEVLDLAHAKELEQLKREQPNAHLILGRAYAKAGVLDAAEKEFRLVSGSDADYTLAQKFIHDLKALRSPGN